MNKIFVGHRTDTAVKDMPAMSSSMEEEFNQKETIGQYNLAIKQGRRRFRGTAADYAR